MRKNLFKVLCIMLTFVFAFTGCGEKKSEKEQFKVGMEAGYAPFNWTQIDDKNGGVKIEGTSEFAGGYDVEIAKKIAEGLGKELVIVKVEWDGLVPALMSGKVDAIIAGMSATTERKQTIDFSDAYYKTQFVMVVKNDGNYVGAKKIADFSGAKVTAQLNTAHYGVIDQIPGVKKQPAMDNFPAMRVALETGVIDAYVSEKPEAMSAQSANNNFKMVELEDEFVTNPEDTEIAIGLKKDSPLKDKVNEILTTISQEKRNELMEIAIKNQPAAQ